MFALEIQFRDGVSLPEVILVRRPTALIGSSDEADVLIEGGASSFGECRLIRGLGREFRCIPVRRGDRDPLHGSPALCEGTFAGEATLALGEVSIRVVSLDVDLQPNPGETPDRSGVRVLRRALTTPSPFFPGVLVNGPVIFSMSFPPYAPLSIGKARTCGLRLDANDIGMEHAVLGFEAGAFWIEDLGTAGGTFVGAERIQGKRRLDDAAAVIRLGRDFQIVPVANSDDLSRASAIKGETALPIAPQEKRAYPCVISVSPLVRPSRLVLGKGRISIGRDPANSLWVGAPYASRRHAEIGLNEAGQVDVTDLSSNGIFVDGEQLSPGEPCVLPRGLSVLDLGPGLSIAVCESEFDEGEYRRRCEDLTADRATDDFSGDDVPGTSQHGDEDLQFQDLDANARTSLQRSSRYGQATIKLDDELVGALELRNEQFLPPGQDLSSSEERGAWDSQAEADEYDASSTESAMGSRRSSLPRSVRVAIFIAGLGLMVIGALLGVWLITGTNSG